MKRESSPTLTARDLETGQLEIVENGGVTFSATELLTLIKTAQIPLIDPPRFDERRFCRHAISGDTAGGAACACLVSEQEGVRPYCSLNGRERRDPCVFDEPDDAPVWDAIRAYVAEVERLGGW